MITKQDSTYFPFTITRHFEHGYQLAEFVTHPTMTILQTWEPRTDTHMFVPNLVIKRHRAIESHKRLMLP